MEENPYQSPGELTDDLTEGPDISRDVNGIQIVTASLLIGVLFFAGIAIVNKGMSFDTPPDIMFWLGLSFAAISFVVQLVVPAVMRRQQLSQLYAADIRTSDGHIEPQRFLGVYRGIHIIACALLEGAAFFNIICYIAEGFVGSLGVALFLALCIAARFPTTQRIRSWIRTAVEEMALR